MTSVLRLLKELKFEMVKVAFLHSFLDSVLIFFGLALVCTLLNINLGYLTVPIFILFGILLILKIRRATLRKIERQHPEVNEMLRTAADTKDDDSFMVRAFHFDLFKAVKRVDSASFLNMPRVLAKIIIIVLFAVSTVTLSATHFHVLDVGKYVNAGLYAVSTFNPGDIIPGGERVQDDKIADLGKIQQEVSLTPLSYELDISSVSKPDLELAQAEEKSSFPVVAVQTESYEDNIPEDQREIVKNYFKLIR
ncbi:MAG: hypothetical protein V1735_07415 [Nanoarchaeota archaeon]